LGRRYPERPIVGVAGIVLDGERVLLVRRAAAPQQGLWSLPGGALEVGETIVDGLRREIREETGLEAHVGPLVEVFERILHDSAGAAEYHYVLLDYLCVMEGGALKPGDDAADAAWFERAAVELLDITAGTPAVIEKAFRMRKAGPTQ
jgi:8-oxo-dGTP diphosphatase